MLLCKDKNFKANHNVNSLVIVMTYDVCYYAKIRILKQITTPFQADRLRRLMFVTM